MSPTESAIPGPSVADSPSPPRRTGCGCWTLATVVGFVLFIFGVYAVWRWSNARALERMIAIAREKGEPTTPEEFAEFHARSPATEETTRLWLAAMEHASRPATEDAIDVAIVGYPRLEDSDSVAASARFRESGVMSPEIHEASKTYLTKIGDAIELAHAARRSGTLARYPLDRETSLPTDPASISQRRQLINVLSLDQEMRRREGATDRFGENLLTLVAFAESAREEPDKISQLVRCATLDVARGALLESLRRDELSDAELTELQRAWSEVDLFPALELMLFERQLRTLHELPMSGTSYLTAPDWRPCPEEDAFQAARALRRVIDAAHDLELADAALAEVCQERDRALATPLAKYRFPGWSGVLDIARTDVETLRRHQTQADATVVALACERCRRERGDWPKTLKGLVPEFLAQVPPDRWIGDPMRYRCDGDEIAVYGVGYDRTDDDGALHADLREEPIDFGVRLSRKPTTDASEEE